MKINTGTLLRILILVGSIYGLSGCTRKAQDQTSRVTLQFSDTSESSKVLSVQSVNSITTQKPNFNYDNIPSKYQDIDCVAIFIGGPEDSMRTNYCQKALDKSQTFKFGVFAGSFAKGQSISLDVPSGSSRNIRMYGLKKPSTSSECPVLNGQGADNLLSGFSPPYFLGESVPTEMAVGATITVNLPIVASIDPQAFFNDCSGPDFGSKTPGSGNDSDPGKSNRPYFRVEGLYNFNIIENPSFSRGMTKGSCYPVAFANFQPCNGGVCTPYVLQNPLTVNITGFKVFATDVECITDLNAISSFTIPAGQSRLPANGQVFMRMPLNAYGYTSTNLNDVISISSTAEVEFTQPSYTHIDFVKPKIIVTNAPATVNYGTCASGTLSSVVGYEDSAMSTPVSSHEPYAFETVFLNAQSQTCGANVSTIPGNQSVIYVNFGKPSAGSSGFTGTSVNVVYFDSIVNKYYVGGLFTAFGGKGVSNLVRLNYDGTYDPSFDVGIGPDGVVKTIVSDGMGGVFIGGQFNNFNGILVNKFAHLSQDGSVDTSYSISFNSSIETMLLSGNRLFVGGAFTIVNSLSLPRLVMIDVGTKTLSNTDFGITSGTNVSALATNGSGRLFVGGVFSNLFFTSRVNIGAINLVSLTLDSWYPAGGASTAVYTLAYDVSSGNLIAGGIFTTIGGQARNRIAFLDSSGSVAAVNPNMNGGAYALHITGSGTVIAGGAFTTVNGATSRSAVAELSTTTGTATVFSPMSFLGTVSSIAQGSGASVVVAGPITGISGQTIGKIAALDISSSNLSTTQFQPYMGTLIFNALMYDFIPVVIP